MCKLPTLEDIQKYSNAFRLVYEVTEYELYSLFSQPATRGIVKSRVDRLNAIYSTRISNEDKDVLINRILALDIESKAKGDSINAEYVSALARKGNGLKRNALSFSSKYFSFCNPDVYPLFDNNVMEYLKEMNKIHHFDNRFGTAEISAIRREVNYARFVEIWSAFRSLSDDLSKAKVNDLDKYIWIKGARYFDTEKDQ